MFAFGCGVSLVIHWLGVRRRAPESGAYRHEVYDRHELRQTVNMELLFSFGYL